MPFTVVAFAWQVTLLPVAFFGQQRQNDSGYQPCLWRKPEVKDLFTVSAVDGPEIGAMEGLRTLNGWTTNPALYQLSYHRHKDKGHRNPVWRLDSDGLWCHVLPVRYPNEWWPSTNL